MKSMVILAVSAQSVADFFANILRGPGEMMRQWVVAVPPPMARGIFLAYFLLLALWILRLPRGEVVVAHPKTGKLVNLRYIALLALVSQIVIYSIF
ncbi:MAG: hypothetical protein PHF14_08930 [Verrucomicrobiota bacterium]|jgi:hypothetical protein|nr:hypothetical protein [Verrucomicrobiota bacterium]MDD8050008.1 hypothetical protein [Verrucomicrobiota bacterium]MDI9384953.1 hypothetical protein [Verrucomicrobiota bacterium]